MRLLFAGVLFAAVLAPSMASAGSTSSDPSRRKAPPRPMPVPLGRPCLIDLDEDVSALLLAVLLQYPEPGRE